MAKGPASNTPYLTHLETNPLHVAIDSVILEIGGWSTYLPTKTQKTFDKDNRCIFEASSRYLVPGAAPRCSAVFKCVKLRLSQEVNTEVSVSIPKFLTGQNYWGSRNLRKGVGEVLARSFRKLREFSSQPKKCNTGSMYPHQIRLKRVDLFCCFCLTPQQVNALIRHLTIVWGTRRRGNISKGPGYIRWSSRWRPDWCVVIYDKAREVAESSLASQASSKADTGGLPEGTVKVELRLLAGELKRLNLSELTSWTVDTPAELYARYVGDRMNLASFEVPALPLSNKALKKVPARMRPPYALAASGWDLERVYSYQSVRRYEKWFAEKNIAISVPTGSRSISVSKILSSARALTHSQIPASIRKGFETTALDEDKRNFPKKGKYG